MSEPTENSAPDPMCERALDYAYGELDGAQAAEFERHMKDCARCQSELALMKRVRTAVRAVLPSVEPPQAATGALHAQLLHAAAQRRPPRTGKVLQFARRVVSHPGYAAAAGLVIIGGAIGLQFARGGLQMPMHAAAPSTPVEASPVEAPKPAVAAGPAPAPAEPPVEGAIANNKDEAKFKKSADKETAAPEKPAALAERKPMADETAPDLYLRRAEPVAAKAPAPTHHASKPAASPKTLSADDSGIVYDGKLGNTGIGRVTGEVGGAGGGESSGGYKQQQQQQSWGGRAAGNSGVVKGGSANYRDQQQQAAAPHTRSAMPKADAFDAPSASPSASPPPPPPARYAQAPEPQAPQAQAPSAWNGNNSPSPPAEKAREVQAEQNQQAPGAAALQQPMQK
ncbi:MAG TPA: zf-HC2 domain-containing protein, partial [Polyangia bacterium]|nr:zf-HC2 domain-containing protein [Polyangia bacterium]